MQDLQIELVLFRAFGISLRSNERVENGCSAGGDRAYPPIRLLSSRGSSDKVVFSDETHKISK
jgi:hypothetical protein